MRQVDYLIIGQGLAGTLLAYFLLRRQKEIVIVDQFNPSSASQVGAGIFNPVTGQRNVKTWMADVLFPFAESTYTEMESYLDCTFYHRMNLVKLFSDDHDREDWSAKMRTSDISCYVTNDGIPEFKNQWVVNSLGGVELKNTGYVDMVKLTTVFKVWMITENLLVERKFDYNDLVILEDAVRWKDIQARKIVFCEGYKARQNPFFQWLPFVFSKGEMLTIHDEKLNLTNILNKGIFVLPIGGDTYKVGSTYTWNDLDENPTEEGKAGLNQRLGQIITSSFTVFDHQAGIRPTVKDRKPLLGLHPEKQVMAIFNGLGTKGVSQAPFFANHLVEFLEERKPLEKTVDIRRFFKFYLAK
ncbi:MAG TPA: FAD-dependent oxidoreductase [Bacteroidales bacterium]